VVVKGEKGQASHLVAVLYTTWKFSGVPTLSTAASYDDLACLARHFIPSLCRSACCGTVKGTMLPCYYSRSVFASMNYRIWRNYTELGDRAKSLEVLIEYSSLFLNEASVTFCCHDHHNVRLYETRPESISVNRLLQELSYTCLRIQLKANGRWRKTDYQPSRRCV
jgi:hypothetical protein